MLDFGQFWRRSRLPRLTARLDVTMRAPFTKRLLFGLYCAALPACLYVNHRYMLSGTIVPDATHTIPFDGDGARVYLSVAMQHYYYLLLLGSILLGVLSGTVYLADQFAEERR